MKKSIFRMIFLISTITIFASCEEITINRVITLEFNRIPNTEGGLDSFKVTARNFIGTLGEKTIYGSDGTAYQIPTKMLLPAPAPEITLGKGAHSAPEPIGPTQTHETLGVIAPVYEFTVTPTETGEHPVKVCFGTLCKSETAVVFKNVHPDWGQPMSVSGLINTAGYEDGITISPDGRYLFTQTGPNYSSADFLFNTPRANGGCGGNLLYDPLDPDQTPDRCTHQWIDEVAGPYSAPERPGFHDGRIGPDGKYLHNSISWSMPPGTVQVFSPSTMFYGFKRQLDGSFAEPFHISFDDQNDGLAGPFGMSFVMTGDDHATMIFTGRDDTEGGIYQTSVDSDGDGNFESKSGFDIYTLDVKLGENTSLGETFPTGIPGTPPTRGDYWPIKPVNFSDVGKDGMYGTQGNGHLYTEEGVIKSIWTDDEYDHDEDTGKLSVYVLTSGSFPDGNFEKVILPSNVNVPGVNNKGVIPFFTGQGIYFSKTTAVRPQPDIWYVPYTGAQTKEGYADNANWGVAVPILQYDETASGIAPVLGAGESTIGHFEGKEYLYFVYMVKRSIDPSTGIWDLNFQAGFVKKN